MESKVITVTNENYAEFLNQSYDAHLCRVRFNGSQKSTIFINQANVTIKEEPTGYEMDTALTIKTDKQFSTIYLNDFKSWTVVIEME